MKQRSYTLEYRANSVKLAEKIGASAASWELKISSNTLYTWIKRVKSGDLPLSTTPVEPKNAVNLAGMVKELEQQIKMLQSENAQIKRENEILEDAAAFFAARRKKSERD